GTLSRDHTSPTRQRGRFVIPRWRVGLGNESATMPEFSYVAMERTGIKKQGSLTAGSEREAMAMLDARGLFPVNITAARSASKGSFGWSRKVKSRYTAAFYAQLADLLRSGVPLLRSLDILERQTSH